MTVLYIDHVLGPHVVPLFALRRNSIFQHDNARAHSAKATWDFLQDNNVEILSLLLLVWTWTRLSIYGMRFKDNLMKSNQGRQLQPTLVHPSLGFVLVFLNHLIDSMYMRFVAVINANRRYVHDTDFRSSLLLILWCIVDKRIKHLRNLLCLEIYFKWLSGIF